MHRIDTATKAADLFGAGKDGFRDGNKTGGVEATALTAAFFNDVQENLAGVVEGAGIALVKGDGSQLRQAITKMIQTGQRAVIVDNAPFAGAVVGTGKAVYWDSANNRFDLAAADGSVKQSAVGFADVTNAKVYCFGSAALFAGLTPGARYYLDAAGGGITSAMPAANAVFVGIAKSATELFVDIDAPVVVTAASDPTFADNSGRPASTSWLRSGLGAIAIAAGFLASFTPNGFVKLPWWLGSVVFQWGTVTVPGTGDAIWAFPISFPNSVLKVLGSTANSTSFVSLPSGPSGTSNIAITLRNTSNVGIGGGVALFAVGF